MQIRSKFSFFTNAAVALASCALIVLAALIYSRLLNENMAETRRRESLNWRDICREAIARHDERFLVQYVKLFENRRDMEYAFFVDMKGRILTHTYRRFIGRPMREWDALRKDTQEISIPVRLQRNMIGRAVTGFSERYRRRTLHDTLLIALLQILIVAGALAAANLVATGLFADHLAKKLRMLQDASRKIENGDFNARVPADSEDEAGVLAKSFNQMAERLGTLDQMKDEFISMVSHELKAPLSAVIMWADYLLEADQGKLSPKQREVITLISDNASRLSAYVRNILDAAKIKAGRMAYHMRPMGLKEAVEKSVTLYEILARKKGVAIDVKIPGDLPELMADAEHLEQALANLISNSLKFVMRDGRVMVEARAVNSHVEVSVSDTGLGIAKEEMAHLFEPFRQFGVGQQRRRGIKGTGLGLYIVKQNVEAMGGSVLVESQEGKGSRFTLKLAKA